MIDAAILVAIIGAFLTFSVFLAERRGEALERKRRLAAEALSDALVWLELPYRIRRRTDDGAGTLSEIADRVHHLQERHVFHKSWLQVEMPDAHAHYVALQNAIRELAGSHIQDAWNSGPADRPKAMNIGMLFEYNLSKEVDAYVEAVRNSFAFLPLPRFRYWGQKR